MIIGRREIDDAAFYRLLVLRFAHRLRTFGGEDVDQQAGPFARQMQHHKGAGRGADDDRVDAAGERIDGVHSRFFFWKMRSSRTISSNASAWLEKRSDSFAPSPRKLLRHSDSRNRPSARSCNWRLK